MCMIMLVSLCKVFEKLKAIWATVVRAASTYMKEQTSRHHFEFFGLDLIADTSGRCWLIEINRLPGLESSKQNKKQEDEFYNTMMSSLLHIVLHPVMKNWFPDITFQPPSSSENDSWILISKPHDTMEPPEVKCNPNVFKFTDTSDVGGLDPTVAATWKNTLRWKAFTRKNRHKVLASFCS